MTLTGMDCCNLCVRFPASTIAALKYYAVDSIINSPPSPLPRALHSIHVTIFGNCPTFRKSKPHAVNLNLISGFLFFAPQSPIFFDQMFRFGFLSGLRWFNAIFQAWDDPFSSASASNEAPKSDATPSHPGMYRMRTGSSTTVRIIVIFRWWGRAPRIKFAFSSSYSTSMFTVIQPVRRRFTSLLRWDHSAQK
ncbi:hypothetical protein B0H19DRAFT_1082316 [Mycena capillaripes]|nr:hypothetical protein B0H19DRAFT_1082316 [Mycena capillaripes]